MPRCSVQVPGNAAVDSVHAVCVTNQTLCHITGHLTWPMFYLQGDEEERLGLPKSFLCDRSLHDKDFLPSQIGFITFVVRVRHCPLTPVVSPRV